MPSPEMMRCLGCGYDLRGLPENRCPECGRAFDPDNPETYFVSTRSGRAYLLIAVAGAAVFAAGATTLILTERLLAVGAAWMLPAALLLIPLGLLMQLVVLDPCLRAIRKPRRSAGHWGSYLAAFAISALIVAGAVTLILAALVSELVT